MYDGANSNLSTFTDAFNRALSDGLARVLSTGWGGAEFDGIPQSVMDTDHGIFNAMIGQGWTLVAASGDYGATADCLNQDAVLYPGVGSQRGFRRWLCNPVSFGRSIPA